VGVLLPLGGPSFPENDETFYIKHPELLHTLLPNPQPNPEIRPNPQRRQLYLVRFGPLPESAEQLSADALNAVKGGFPHGVSTFLRYRISGTDKLHRSALLIDVMRHFGVQKTGRRPDHYTVILPNPVTPEVANLFNSLFKTRQ
jgi:hypothetical protein